MRSISPALRLASAPPSGVRASLQPSLRPSARAKPYALRASIAPSPDRPPRIAIADGSSGVDERVSEALRQLGYEVIVRPIHEQYDLLRDDAVDLVLIDMNLPQGTGFELCGELRAAEGWSQTPIILLTSAPEEKDLIVRGLLCGADDCLTSVDGSDRLAELQARIRVQLRNKRERDRLQRVREERDTYFRAAAVDPLTGVANRRALDHAMGRLFAESRQFALLFMDIDFFKKINDEMGHAVGDDVLRALGETLKANVRSHDICGRFGGEEFVILAPDADESLAFQLAEHHRNTIASMVVPTLGRAVTASFGVAVFEPGGPDVDAAAICTRADSALYISKKAGRNRVTVASRETPTLTVEAAPDPLSMLAGTEEMLLKALSTGRAGLPLLPAAAAEALRLAEDPSTSMAQVAHLVDHDPPLAARFVALASSAAFSRGARVSSTQAALVRVGLAASRDLLLRAAYERSNGELPKYQEQVAASFDDSVRLATAAQKVARDVAGPKFDLAYLCGLLHNIGEARIYRVLAGMNLDLDPAVVSNLVARHHMQAGAEVARAWRLPTVIVEACAAHHGPAEGAPVSARVVMAAHALLKLADVDDKDRSRDEEAAAERKTLMSFGVDGARIASLVEATRIAIPLAIEVQSPSASKR